MSSKLAWLYSERDRVKRGGRGSEGESVQAGIIALACNSSTEKHLKFKASLA